MASIARSRRRSYARRRAARRRRVWLSAGLLLVAAAGFGYRSVITDWALAAWGGQDVLADAGTVHHYSGLDDEDVYGNSAHSHFSLGEPEEPQNGTPNELPGTVMSPASLTGAWITNMLADSAAGYLTKGSCEYELTGLNLSLRESDGDIVGFGDYSLLSADCPNGVTAVSAYVAAKGDLNRPYLKLTMFEDEEGPPLFVFYGTARPEGILGQIRTTDGRLLAEHVSLNTPSK